MNETVGACGYCLHWIKPSGHPAEGVGVHFAYTPMSAVFRAAGAGAKNKDRKAWGWLSLLFVSVQSVS